MQRALGTCSSKPDKALIDGKPLPNQIIPNDGIINGDAFVPSIQAASIIAKVTRDRQMVELDKIFPEYGFINHKGYGTVKHLISLEEWKACPVHRKTFAPVQRNLPSINWYIKKRKVGWIGEKLAALFLLKRNHEIITLNENCPPYGELDIISETKNTLIFSEVKTAAGTSLTIPENQIGREKLSRLIKAVHFYLQKNPSEKDIRLDAVLVKLEKGSHEIKRIKGLTLD
tara:strand:- start:107 stop:793 length:687 start_codon:yes stop_codon:yes gene_type:complete